MPPESIRPEGSQDKGLTGHQIGALLTLALFGLVIYFDRDTARRIEEAEEKIRNRKPWTSDEIDAYIRGR